MGHADIRTTMNIYAKAVPGWEEATAEKLDAYLDAAPARQVARQLTPIRRVEAGPGGREAPANRDIACRGGSPGCFRIPVAVLAKPC